MTCSALRAILYSVTCCHSGVGVFVGRAIEQGEECGRSWSHHRCPSRVSRRNHGTITSWPPVSCE